MDCDRFSSFLVAAALSGEVLEVGEVGRAHLAGCPGCAERLSGLESLVAGIRDSRPSAAMGRGIEAGLDGGLWLEEPADLAAGEGACGACLASVSAAERKSCQECGVVYHGACWKKNEGCAAVGCALNPESAVWARPSARLTAARPRGSRSRVAWGLIGAAALGLGAAAALRSGDEAGPPMGSSASSPGASGFAFPLADLRGVEPLSPYRPLPLGAEVEEVAARIARLSRALERIEAQGGVVEAQGWRARLSEIERVLGDEGGPEAGIMPELHVVACGEPERAEEAGSVAGRIRVRVTRRGPPVTLFLCAAAEARWRVELADGVDLQAVYLTGEGAQSIEGVAEGLVVRAEDRRDRRRPLPRFAFDLDADNRSELVAMTGLEPRSVLYRRRLGEAWVGPESRAWRYQVVLRRADALFQEVLRFELAEEQLTTRRLAAELAESSGAESVGSAPRFHDLFPPLTLEKARRRGLELRPPPVSPQSPFPLCYDLERDEGGGRIYLVGEEGLYGGEEGGRLRRLPIARARSLALDPVRRRLLVGDGRGFLSFVDLGSEAVTPVGEGGPIVALDYDAAGDVFYALECDGRGDTAIAIFDGEARPGGRFKAPQAFADRFRSFGLAELAEAEFFARCLQLRARGERLVVSACAPVCLPGRGAFSVPRIRLVAVFDAASRELVGEGLEMDRPVRQWIAGRR